MEESWTMLGMLPLHTKSPLCPVLRAADRCLLLTIGPRNLERLGCEDAPGHAAAQFGGQESRHSE
jgi:hypothetical protein